jgi:hypothetical protein
MSDGVFNGLNLSEADQQTAKDNIHVLHEGTRTGSELCGQVLDPLLDDLKPDLVWLDPALAYMGGDMNNQKEVGKFLRGDLAPLLVRHDCAAVIVHHTNKISKDPEKQMTDASYLGAGSAEWINWCRAMLVLRQSNADSLYELKAAKRGGRLKWRSEDGQSPAFHKFICHSRRPDTICWMEISSNEAETLRASNRKTAADVLKHVPYKGLVSKPDLIERSQREGIGKHRIPKLLAELLRAETLFEYKVARPEVRPVFLFSRQKLVLDDELKIGDFEQDSRGHYQLKPKAELQTANQVGPVVPPKVIPGINNQKKP